MATKRQKTIMNQIKPASRKLRALLESLEESFNDDSDDGKTKEDNDDDDGF